MRPDGARVPSTRVLTNTDRARLVSADTQGLCVVCLVVSGKEDGIDIDHADWADLKIGC
ncbi:NPCBM/NEW2 domain-containing protein [Streptomyces sp. NPDC055078]